MTSSRPAPKLSGATRASWAGRSRLPIVALAPAAWDGPWGTWNQLLSRLADRRWPTVYSNGPLSLWDRGKSDWKEARLRAGFSSLDGVLVDRPGRVCAGWPRSDMWMRLVNRCHARHLLGGAGVRRGGKGITYVFHPAFARYMDLLDLRHVVYLPYDLYSLTADWTPQIERAEAALVRRADLVITLTNEVAQRLPGIGDKEARVLPSAVDVASYASGNDRPCPDDLAAVPRPRVSFVGRMTPKVDFDLVADIASERPDWHWVMVGPVLLSGAVGPEAEARARAGRKRCAALPNVHFLGAKHHTELPAYMAHMDVNTMCYRSEGGWWVFGSPLKLYEYLAVGRPVVGTPLRAVRPFAHVVDLAETREEWLSAIDRALHQGGVGTPEQRHAVALENSWDKRVDQLEAWLFEMIEKGENASKRDLASRFPPMASTPP